MVFEPKSGLRRPLTGLSYTLAFCVGLTHLSQLLHLILTVLAAMPELKNVVVRGPAVAEELRRELSQIDFVEKPCGDIVVFVRQLNGR